MNRPELFTKTYETLVTAWDKGELMHDDCTACAVGNICAGDDNWQWAFCTYAGGNQSEYWRSKGFPNDDDEKSSLELIDSTGYTVEELSGIEYAFESSIGHDYDNLYKTSQGQYIGLRAVMDVLWEIHELEDQSLTNLNRVASSKGVEVNA